MAVGRDYMLKKGAGPSAPKFFFDTQLVPFVVNTAGRLEVALDRTSVRTGVRPAAILAGSTGSLLLVFFYLLRRRRSR